MLSFFDSPLIYLRGPCRYTYPLRLQSPPTTHAFTLYTVAPPLTGILPLVPPTLFALARP
jgi:hypothetical protein